LSCPLSSVSFFFQAEDGIRGRNVTGVQTCALPIWAGSVAITLLVHDLVETVELIIFVRITVIVTVVLHEAEVDRHLAHRAGHLMSSVVPAAFSPQPTLLRTEPVCPCTGGESPIRANSTDRPQRPCGDLTPLSALDRRATPYRYAGVSHHVPRPLPGLHSSPPRPLWPRGSARECGRRPSPVAQKPWRGPRPGVRPP